MLRQLILLFFIISFSGYSQTKYTITNISKELKENANSVLLDEKIEIDVTNADRLIYSIYRVKAILNKKGNKDVRAYINYDKDTRIKKLEVYIYDAFGNELKHYKKRDFVDVSASDGISIYNDDRVMYLNYTPTVYPYIIVFNSEIENNTTAFIPSWQPVGWYSRSVKKSIYKIKFDPTNKPRIKSENLEGYDISVSENPNEFICIASNIKALVYEEQSPSFSKIAPSISFALNRFSLIGVSGYAKNWQEFGLWMQKSLLAEVGDLPVSTILEVKNLINNESTNQEKAKIIYNYLQEKVRYISVQIGIGGWKPMLASEVDKLSYGDCKALTNYTKALLDAVGVPSYYTVLYAGDNKRDISKDFSRIQGNHVILGVPDGDDIVWLECTSQDMPYGFIGDFSDDRDVLIITPKGGEIVHTKEYNYNDNLQVSFIKIDINKEGGAKVEFKSISEGIQYGDKYRIENKNNEDINKHYKNKWGNINGYTIDNIKLDNNRDKVIFTEELVIDIPKYCSVVGNDFLISTNIFNQSNYIPPRIKNRKYKLHIAQGFEDKDKVEITLPEGYRIEELPESKVIENKFGSYSIDFKMLSDNKIEYLRHFIIKKGTFSAEEYKNYRNFRRKISRLDKTKILLIKQS